MEIRANNLDAADLAAGEAAFESGKREAAYKHLLEYCNRHVGENMSARAETLYATLLAADLMEEMSA